MYTYSQISDRRQDNGSYPARRARDRAEPGHRHRAPTTPRATTTGRPSPPRRRWRTRRTTASRGWQTLFKPGRTPATGTAGVDTLKAYLAPNKPVCDRHADRERASTTCAAPTVDTDTTSDIHGGHEMLAVGYDARACSSRTRGARAGATVASAASAGTWLRTTSADAWMISGITFGHANTNTTTTNTNTATKPDDESRSRRRPGQGLHGVERRA